MAKKKKDDVDESTPVLGTGAVGDVEHPEAGEPTNQPLADAVRDSDDDDDTDDKDKK